MIAILKNEQQNARDTIPLVEFDSILGFEPSMEYVTDRKRLEWKIAQVDEEIAMLCDIAMCGDHGIGESYGAVLDLPKCIAKGDDICSLRYHK